MRRLPATRSLVSAALALGLAVLVPGLNGCSTEQTAVPIYNPLDPANRPDLAVPVNLLAEAGTDRIQLSWELPAGYTGPAIDEYAIFRREVDATGITIVRQSLLARVTGRAYLDVSAKNGLHYVYNVAAGANGQFGGRSRDGGASPALFNMVLNDDAPTTRDPRVSVQFVAPTGTEAVQIYELPNPAGAAWRPLGQGTNWTLTSGDGVHTVYARFRLPGGGESLPVSDTIRLDTQARIQQVSFDGAAVKAPGDPLHLSLDGGETGGSARVEIPGLFVTIGLYDDGTNGDGAAGDGVYELETRVPAGQSINGSVVTGRFTDAVGNEALAFDAERRLTVEQPPDAVNLISLTAALPPAAAAITVEWSTSGVADFAAYRIVRFVGDAPGTPNESAALVTTRGQTLYVDQNVQEGRTYTYRIAVITNSGLESNSNSSSLLLPNARPPAAVTLQAADGVSTTRAVIRWSRTSDLDFGSYRLYRSESAAVDNSGTPVVQLTSPDATSYVDDGLDENVTYHYRLYVVDRGGLSTGSNEIETRTANLPPPGVQLNPATSVSPTGVTLTWSLCDAHDFQFYRVYRSDTPNVTTAATIVREVDERTALTFRDTSVLPGRTFYYRIYVFDNGVNPGPLASGSNTISVTTPGS